MPEVLMFLSQGFEDLEAATIVDVFGWTRLRDNTESISLKICGFHDEVAGRFGTRFKVDINLSNEGVDSKRFDGLVIPGGFHSHGFDEAYCEQLHTIARSFHENEKPIGTLCVGVLPIADAGLLAGKRATTYELSQVHDNPERLKKGGALYTGNEVESDGGVISCSGPAQAMDVAFKLVELLTGKGNLETVKKLMIA